MKGMTDGLSAKLVAHGRTRDEALTSLRAALDQTLLLGFELGRQHWRRSVGLTARGDSTDVRATTVTHEDGAFAFPALRPGTLRLEVTRLGYLPLRQPVALAGADLDLGTLTVDLNVLVGGRPVRDGA